MSKQLVYKCYDKSNAETVYFYDDYTYRYEDWSSDLPSRWKIAGNGQIYVKHRDYKPGQWLVVSLDSDDGAVDFIEGANMANNIIQFNREVEEHLSES